MFHFNSIKVRLEHRGLSCCRVQPRFQFHKGTIRTIEVCNSDKSRYNFNSIKVRLEPYAYAVFRSYVSFQFHKGTIRTKANFLPVLILPYFNSIKVRLELLLQVEHQVNHQYFNSIKVRLEPEFQKICQYGFIFQFHKGTIRTQLLFLFLVFKLNFNSIKVRLEHKFAAEHDKGHIISIP